MVVLILSWRPRRPIGAVKRTWYGKMFVKNLNNFTFGVYWPHWPVCSISASRTWSNWPLWESDSAEGQQKFVSFKKIEAPLLLSCKPKFLPYFESNESSHARKHARAHSHTYTRLWNFHCNVTILFKPRLAHFFLPFSFSEYKFIHRLRIPPVCSTLLLHLTPFTSLP